ncbi:hypothetical protein [Flavobacterium sp.]|uniref:hypothetical protein n=1 Tax=Flavobacterium sp. TaxID=239 RepID=UPI003340FE8D
MEVKLFIYQDATIYNQIGITADSTLITADSTLITADRTFELVPSVSRVAIPIDLFNDEVITLNSSIQNINDLSRVFTDYSQSFTIPASKKNNETFRHWYENEVDNGFNQLIRYDGFIEIDNEIFRVGKWQLESASIKQNKIENYKLTFYGVLTSLTDKFREDKLKDLETLNDYTIEYSGSNVKTSIETTNNDNVGFPLISSSKVWQYGGGGSTLLNWDISNNATPMSYTELFPALKIARIFDAIESKYNVSFQGNFLTQSRFTEAFLWLKNKETFVPSSAPVRVDISTIVSTPFDTSVQISFDTLENTYEVLQEFGTILFQAGLSVSSTWIVSIFKNNQFYTNQSGTGNFISVNLPNEVGTFYLTIQTSSSCTYNSDIIGHYQEWNDPFGQYEWIDYQIIGGGSGTTNSQLDLTQYVPDMKVSDFVSAILKMFNLTAFSENESVYTFEQLENWYYQGQIKNLTQYTITDLDFERIKPYKKINFEYEKSESFMNRAFFDNGAREYGNLSYTFNTDGNDYTIKLPFENLLFNKFNDINLQVGYSINKTFQTYIPKPVILYKLGNVASGDFKFNNGTTTSTIANYNVFGQDVNYQNTKQTLNWGIEISSYYLNTITNTLFQNYYFNYLSNLYSLKSRMVKVSMRLPYSELLSLKLNDRIVIRDKRYIINQFTTNLKTFEVQMELIQDFRSILFNNSVGRITDSSAKTLRFDTTSNEPLTWEIQQDLNGQIISINDFDSYVEVETKQNFTGSDLFYSIISNNNDIIVITQNG